MRWVRVVVVVSLLPDPMLPDPMLPAPILPLAPLVPGSLPLPVDGPAPLVPAPLVPVSLPEPLAPGEPEAPEVPVLLPPVLLLPVLLPAPMVPVSPPLAPEGDCSVVVAPPEALPPGEVELPWASAAPQVAVTARPASRLRKRVDAVMWGTP
jgi:signal-induced proliferation-associated 1 like protein 3